MPNVNKAIVMGVLGRAPEIKSFANGSSITIFSVRLLPTRRARPLKSIKRLLNV